MLHVPNVHISVQTTRPNSFTEVRPRWFAPLFRAIWADRGLDPERGVRVDPLPEGIEGNNAGRYSVYDSVEQAEQQTLSVLTAGLAPELASARIALFHRLFPTGLRDEIAAILAEEQKQARARAHNKKVAAVPNPAFRGLISDTQALALQSRGIASPTELAVALGDPMQAMTLAECGLTPDNIANLEVALAEPVAAVAEPEEHKIVFKFGGNPLQAP